MEKNPSSIRIRIDTAAVFGYVQSRGMIPLVNSVTLECPEDIPGRSELRLEFAPEIFRPCSVRIGELRKGSRVVVPRLGEPVVSALLGEAGRSVRITASLMEGGGLIAACEKLVPLAAFDSFSPVSVYPSLCASFVLPDSAAVAALAGRISGDAKAGKLSPSGIAARVREVYELLKECGIAYSVRQYSAEKNSEHVRPAPVCLRAKSGDSLELALLFASVCEALGLDVSLLFFASSVMIAVRLSGEETVLSELHDGAVISAALGNGELAAVDPSGICYGTDIPFSVSCDKARKAISAENLLAAVNVRAARREGILPLPAELCGDDGALPARDILTSGSEQEKKDEAERLFSELSRQSGFSALTDCGLIPVDLGPEKALSGAPFALPEEAAVLAHPCLCIGAVGFFDPLKEKQCRAPALILPLEQSADGAFFALGTVCNTVLFERLAELSGFDINGALAAYGEGTDALLDFVRAAASMSDSFEIGSESASVYAASLRAELAAAHAALRRFSLPSGGAAIPAAGGGSFDRSFNRALETALSGGFTAVRSSDPSVRERFALTAAVSALSAGHRVLFVSDDPKILPEKIRQLALKGGEKVPGAFDGDSLDEVFRDRPQGFSFYTAAALADRYRGAEKPVDLPPVLFDGLTERDVNGWSETLARLIDAMEKTGGVGKNPLRDVASPSFDADILEKARGSATRCTGALQSFMAALSDAAVLLQVSDCDGPGSMERLLAALKILADGEKLPHYYFENRLPDTLEVVRTMKNHWILKKELEKVFSKDVFTLDVLELKSRLRSAALLGGHKKRALEKSVFDDLRGCALGEIDRASVTRLLNDLDRVREYGDYTAKNSEHLRSCLGVDVTSPDTEKEGLWDRLERTCADAARFESAYLALAGSDPAAVPSVLRTPELSERAAAAASRIEEAFGRYSSEYDELKRLLGLRSDGEDERSGLGGELARLSVLRDGIDGLESWTDWLKVRHEAISLGLGDAVKQCESGAFGREQLRENFLCGFFNSLCRHIISVSPALSGFDAARQTEMMKAACAGEAAALSAAAADASGLVSAGLIPALSDGSVYSLVIVTDAHLIAGCVGAGLFAKGRSVVTVGDPLSDLSSESLSGLALRLGAADRTVAGFVGSSVCGADAACRFASDLAGVNQFAVYPASERSGVRILNVKGGYDDGTVTNVIEAKVIVDELEDCVRSGVRSVGIVTLGAAQKTLVTRMLAGKLSGDPGLREMLLGKNGVSFFISSFDEEPGEADVILLSLCFSSAESGYGRGLSPKLFGVLGANCAHRLGRLFILAKKYLTVACSFGFEELSNTCSTLGGVGAFRLFCARLFALENAVASVDLSPGRPHEPIMERVADDLRGRGWLVRANCGFGRIRTDLMIRDPFDAQRRFAVVSDAALRDGVESALAGELISGFADRGICVFRFCFADWFSDSAAVLSALNTFLGADPGSAQPFEGGVPAGS